MTYSDRQDYQRQHPGQDPYFVQPGDTLESVAAEHGVPVAQMSELNGIASNARIRPGQVLAIVGGQPDGVYLYVEAGDGWVGPSLQG